MKQQVLYMLARLRKPNVVLSIASQIVTLLMLLGFEVNQSLVLTITTVVCSILVALGVLSNPDTQKKGYGDDFLVCSRTGDLKPHIMVSGQMVCKSCGAVHCPESEKGKDDQNAKHE